MFLCLSWLAELLAGACTRRQRRRRTARHGGHTPNNSLTETCSLVLPCTSSTLDIHVLWSIDTCQNKVSADQFHVTISQAQVCSSSRSSVFWSWPLTKCWFFDWIAVSCLVNSLKTGTIVALFCIWWLLKLKIEGKTIYRKPQRKVTKLKLKFFFFLG